MSTARKAQYLGGPLDGKDVTVPRGIDVWTVPDATPPVFMLTDETEPVPTVVTNYRMRKGRSGKWYAVHPSVSDYMERKFKDGHEFP
jgi:hypothetical protein